MNACTSDIKGGSGKRGSRKISPLKLPPPNPSTVTLKLGTHLQPDNTEAIRGCLCSGGVDHTNHKQLPHALCGPIHLLLVHQKPGIHLRTQQTEVSQICLHALLRGVICVYPGALYWGEQSPQYYILVSGPTSMAPLDRLSCAVIKVCG